MAIVKKGSLPESWSAETIHEKLGGKYSIESIRQGLQDFGPVSSSDELNTFETLLTESNSALTVTTARETDPDNLTGGIVPSQPTGLGAQVPNIPQGISIPHLESPINLNLGAAQTAQVQAIHLQAQIEQQQALVNGLEAFKHRTSGLAAISTVLNDLELNWALDNAGLSIEGTRDERLERWEQYNIAKHQEINAKGAAINALLAQSQDLLGSFKTRDGRPLIGR